MYMKTNSVEIGCGFHSTFMITSVKDIWKCYYVKYLFKISIFEDLKYLHYKLKSAMNLSIYLYVCVYVYTVRILYVHVSTIIHLTSWCMAGSVQLLTGRVNFRTSPWCCSLCDNSYWHNEEQPTSQQVVLFKEPSHHCTQARGGKKKTPC